MSDQTTNRTTIAASASKCFDVVVDFEHYPEWTKDVKEATILRRDEQGRPVEVEFRAAAMGRSTRYTLGYDYAAAPEKISWHLVHGDIMRAIDGSYVFEPAPGDQGATDVTYSLSIDLVVPLPGFVKRRAEVRILNTIRELKARAEQ
jgi:ribosome-associated toxin RatA of RatAB toxin-antitoxin module